MADQKVSTLAWGRIRDLYSWAYAWRSADADYDEDLSELRETQREEFDQAAAEFEAAIRADQTERLAQVAEQWLHDVECATCVDVREIAAAIRTQGAFSSG